MSKLLLLLLASSAAAQIAKDYAKQLNDQVNAAIQADTDAARKKALDDYMNSAIDTLNSEKKATKEVVLGNFKILIQQNCEIKLPTKPEIPNPVEQECASAHEDAKMLAEKVIDMTQANMQDPKVVLDGMVKCNLNLEADFSVSIYIKCVNAEFEHYYQKYFAEMVDKLKADGLEYNPDTQTFTKKMEKSISLQEDSSRTELVK